MKDYQASRMQMSRKSFLPKPGQDANSVPAVINLPFIFMYYKGASSLRMHFYKAGR